MDILCTADLCPVILNSTCVFYEGNTLTYTGITTNDSLQTALQKIDAKFGDAMVGYTFTNGINQPSAGAPVGLGGNLTANISIGGNFTLTFAGNVKATKLVTTGGTASQFVKGDGTLDSTAYQAAGNYITALTGDVIAAGPGSVAASLAVVNSNPGTYGSGTRIPVVTVDTKGRVTALTTTAINVPSGSLSFVGDVYGSGVTGSQTTLTLNNVNTNVYTNNTFLKFKVNAKGLVTGATPVTNLDIEAVLGYVPTPETRSITINGVTKDLQTNVIFTLPGGGTVQSVSVTAGTGIAASVDNPTLTPNITITNTAPDQVVTLIGQSGIDVTGTYPNFTISANEQGAVTNVTASSPLASSGGQTPNISITQAGPSQNGFLTSGDWNTFNNKQNAIPYTPADDALVVHKAGTETITGQKTFDLSPITQVGLLFKNQSVTPFAAGYSGISADNGNFSLIREDGVHAQLDLTDLTVNREYAFPNANGTIALTSDLAAYQLLLNGTGLVRMSGTVVTYDNTSYTPQSRTLTINGTTYDLSSNRSWSIDSMVYPAAGIAVSTGTAWGTSLIDNSVDWNTAYSLRITSATAPLNITGTTISISQAGASANGFLSSTDWNTFNNKQASGNYITQLSGEATATGPGNATVTLSNTAVVSKVLTGVNITGGTVVGTDTILEAFGKVQNQINGLIGGTVYQGTWNAATNTPTLTSGVGTDGYYYITSVYGTTNLDGIAEWHVGDWAIFHDGAWQKVDNTDAVISVNGFTGAVSLATTNVPEGTNLYYTNTRARQAISLTTTGTSGAATYDNSTGVLNIPQYQGGVTSFNTRTGAITLTSLDVTNALTYTPVTEARTLTINGTTYDLTANRSWSIDSMIYPAAGIAVSTGTAWAASITDNSANWNTAYSLRISSLTTTGSSGAATLSSNVLNIPNYTLSGLGGVPSTRTITINSTTYDLSTDRNWDVGTVTSVAALTIGTTGTDIASSVATGTTTPVITLNVPTANATNRGALSSADWSSFNSKQSALNGTGFVKVSGTTISYDNSTYLTTSAAASTYLALAGGTLTGALVINPANSATVGLDVASNTFTLRTDSSQPFNRQLTTTLGSGTLVKMQAAGFGGTYVTDLGFYTSSSSAINATPNLYLTGGDNRVGVNTTTPAYALDVVGDVNVTGTFRVNGTPLSGGGVTSFNTRTGAITLTSTDVTTALGYTPVTDARTLTINGVTYDLTANRSWTVGASSSARNEQTFTATTGTNTLTVTGGYTVGLVDVYVNGVKYLPSDFTATTSPTVVIAGLVAGDTIDIITYNSTVGNVAGSGTANFVPKFTASGTIGDSAITDNGTTVTLVSRALSGTTANFTGQLTLGSTITNGTLVYTLPSATGTLALTTDIPPVAGVYLPLAGGTLSGQLTATSPGFPQPSLILSGNFDFGTIQFGNTANYNISAGADLISMEFKVGGSQKMLIVDNGNVGINNSNPTFKLDVNGTGRFTGALSGTSATFSGNVISSGIIGANAGYFRIANNAGSVPYGYFLTTSQWTGVGTDNTPTIATETGYGFRIYTNGGSTNGLTLASTGAATFSSSVTAGGFLGFNVGNTNGIIRRTTVNGSNGIRIQGNANDTISDTNAGSSIFVGGGVIGDTFEGSIVLTAYGSVVDNNRNQIIFQNRSGVNTVTERMRINHLGNVGIGTTAPTSFTGYTTVSINNPAGGAVLELQSNGTSALRMACSPTDCAFYEPRNVFMLFGTNNTERMRITAGGQLLVNATIASDNVSSRFYARQLTDSSAFSGVAVVSQASGQFAGAMGVDSNGNLSFEQSYLHGTGSFQAIRFITSGSERMRIASDGRVLMPQVYNNTSGVSANLFIAADGALVRATSSIKYKKDVINYDKGLDLVQQMRPVYYKGISEMDGDRQFAGFIAEEINELGLSEFVQFNNDNEVEGLGYGNITALLVNAIKELKAELDILKNK